MATKIPRVIADLELQLATALAVGGESFTLSSATDDDGETLPAGIYVFAVDSGTSNKEYLLGQVNGTAVTSVKSVSRQGVQTTGAARAHRVGAPIILTNFAALQLVSDTLRGAVDLDGATPLAYDAEPTLGNREELATVGYVLDTATGGTVTFDAQTIAGTAGATIAAGDLVYLNEADQEWYLCDADTAATVEGVMRGIALGSGTDGASITGGVHLAGAWTTTGLTAGAVYYASNTAGALATSAGTTKHIVGVALSTTRLWVIPQHRETIPTRTKDALAGGGDFGTPSATNKFLTENKAGLLVTAGETINGATLPVPVYQNRTDNEFYACDANDSDKYRFKGFAITNASDGTSVRVQFTGVVGGFSGLTEGANYYVQDTAGTIGTTPGTQEILVGVAVSETELFIQKGNLYYKGTYSVGDIGTVGTTQDNSFTCGFRPSKIEIFITSKASSAVDVEPYGYFVWTNNSTSSVSLTSNDSHQITVLSVTDTGYTLRVTQQDNSPDGGTSIIHVATGTV